MHIALQQSHVCQKPMNIKVRTLSDGCASMLLCCSYRGKRRCPRVILTAQSSWRTAQQRSRPRSKRLSVHQSRQVCMQFAHKRLCETSKHCCTSQRQHCMSRTLVYLHTEDSMTMTTGMPLNAKVSSGLFTVARTTDVKVSRQ